MIRAILAVLLASISSLAYSENIIRMSAPIKGASYWVPDGSVSSAWIADGDVVGCNDWSPSTASYPQGMEFMQSKLCFQPYTRSVQYYERNTQTQMVRPAGDPVIMGKNDPVNYNQTAFGTMVAPPSDCKYSLNPSTYVVLYKSSNVFAWFYDGIQLKGNAINDYAMGPLIEDRGTALRYSICKQ